MKTGTLSQRTRNLLSAGILLVVSVFWFMEAAEYPPLSRLYPQVIAAISAVLAVLLGVLTLLGFGPLIRIAAGDANERHIRSGTVMVILVLWTALIPVVGLLAASLLGVAAMGVITFRSHEGTIRAIVIALVSVTVFYFLFKHILNVYFPLGIFD